MMEEGLQSAKQQLFGRKKETDVKANTKCDDSVAFKKKKGGGRKVPTYDYIEEPPDEFSFESPLAGKLIAGDFPPLKFLRLPVRDRYWLYRKTQRKEGLVYKKFGWKFIDESSLAPGKAWIWKARPTTVSLPAKINPLTAIHRASRTSAPTTSPQTKKKVTKSEVPIVPTRVPDIPKAPVSLDSPKLTKKEELRQSVMLSGTVGKQHVVPPGLKPRGPEERLGLYDTHIRYHSQYVIANKNVEGGYEPYKLEEGKTEDLEDLQHEDQDLPVADFDRSKEMKDWVERKMAPADRTKVFCAAEIMLYMLKYWKGARTDTDYDEPHEVLRSMESLDTVDAHKVCVEVLRFMIPYLSAEDRALLRTLLNSRINTK